MTNIINFDYKCKNLKIAKMFHIVLIGKKFKFLLKL